MSTRDSNALITELAQALSAERRAKAERVSAASSVAAAMRALTAIRLSGFKIATRVAASLGVPMSVGDRRRFARALARRAQRAAATSRRRIECPPPGLPELAPASCPGKEATKMARLVKRVTTEEFVEDEDDMIKALEAVGAEVEEDEPAGSKSPRKRDDDDDDDEEEDDDEDE